MPPRGYLKMSRGTFGRVWGAGDRVMELLCVVSREAARHPECTGQTPPQRTAWTEMSAASRLRNSNTKTCARDTNRHQVSPHPPAAGQWEGQ